MEVYVVIRCGYEGIEGLIYASEDGKEEIFNRSWDIPMGSILFHLSSEDGSSKFSIPYSIILDYGTVGFRNNADEAALVKEVLVKKN